MFCVLLSKCGSVQSLFFFHVCGGRRRESKTTRRREWERVSEGVVKAAVEEKWSECSSCNESRDLLAFVMWSQKVWTEWLDELGVTVAVCRESDWNTWKELLQHMSATVPQALSQLIFILFPWLPCNSDLHLSFYIFVFPTIHSHYHSYHALVVELCLSY